MFGISKKDKKDLGKSPEQSHIIISQTYESQLLLDEMYYTVAKEAFKGNPDGFAVVDKICNAVAKLDYKVCKKFKNGKIDEEKSCKGIICNLREREERIWITIEHPQYQIIFNSESELARRINCINFIPFIKIQSVIEF